MTGIPAVMYLSETKSWTYYYCSTFFSRKHQEEKNQVFIEGFVIKSK
jgi:hypothetical protein